MVNQVLIGFVNVTVVRRLLLLELICVGFTPKVVDVISKNKERELPEGQASFNQIHYQYRRNAVVRGYKWSLTKEYFGELTKQNCYYCGALPAQKYRQINSNGWYVYNGIDRVDNSEDYISSNVVPCCIKCNKMKGKLSENEFFEHLNIILKNHPDRETVNNANTSNN